MITIEDVQNAITLEYLNDLETWIDVDITNIGNGSDAIRHMKAKMHGMTVEELDRKQLEELTDLKKAVQKRIIELK